MTQQEKITRLFEAFNQQKILVIGDVMIDAYLWGNVDRISPEAPVPIVSLKKRENRLGGAANVALNIQSMGAVPVLCSVTGNDEKSRTFHELMQQQGLETAGLISSDQRITTTKFRIIGNNAQMLRVDEETEKQLEPVETQLLFERIAMLVAEHTIGAIIFEDYDKGVINAELIDQVVKLAKEKSIPVVVDPKKKNFMNYRGVTLFKPNLKELREGLKLDDELTEIDNIMDAVKRLQELMDVDIALATLSEKGVCYSSKEDDGSYKTGLVPAHVRDIADVSGAGDTVISIIALCMATGTSPDDMARLSNLAGGLVCEYVGVVPIQKERLLQEALKTFQ
ncbi:MAG: bifunctional heptose 7-phosphate kinase/heptose 1-phosphate adenyltransferase [bacterium]